MIPAVADSCSVRLDKVNRKVYKFRALVFRQDAKGNNKEAYINSEKSCKIEVLQAPLTRGILSQERKTEWKCTYGELLSKTKCLQQNEQKLSGLTQKGSNTSQDISNDCETLRKERQRVRFKESQGRDKAESPTCPTCLQIIANEAKDYSCFMEKSKEELVAMLINLKTQCDTSRRKNGYNPTETDFTQTMQAEISSTGQQYQEGNPLDNLD